MKRIGGGGVLLEMNPGAVTGNGARVQDNFTVEIAVIGLYRCRA